MRKNPLLERQCGVCMASFPETEVEYQYLYGRKPWYCCWGCLYTEPGQQKQPDVAFETVMKPEKIHEPELALFDPFDTEEDDAEEL